MTAQRNTHANPARRTVRYSIGSLLATAGVIWAAFRPAPIPARPTGAIRTAPNRPTETGGAMFHAKHPGCTGKRRRRRQRGKRKA